jgi:PPP family 3-phenylpropionic acid transporter
MHVHSRLAAYYFAFFAHAGAFVAYFALWLAARGLSPAEIAFALAMPQLARIIAPTLWGWLADVWGVRYPGARRAIIVFSAFALAAGLAALYFQHRPASIALTLLLLSLASAGAMPLLEAITLSAVGSASGAYGLVRLWGSVGFIVTVLGTGLWLDYRPAETLLDVVLALTLAACAASFALPRGAPAAAHAPAPRLAVVLRQPAVLAFFGACVCMSAAHGAMYVFYAIYLESAGYSKTVIGVLWTVGVVAEIVLFLRLPQLQRRFTLRGLLLASFACAVVRFLAIGWGVEWFAVLAAAQLLHAATFGAFHASSVAAVHRLFPGALAARGQALFSSVTYGLGGAAGSLVAGWTWPTLGPGASFTVSAAFGAAGAALVLWKVRV